MKEKMRNTFLRGKTIHLIIAAFVFEHLGYLCRLPNKCAPYRYTWSGLVHEDKLTGTVACLEMIDPFHLFSTESNSLPVLDYGYKKFFFYLKPTTKFTLEKYKWKMLNTLKIYLQQ